MNKFNSLGILILIGLGAIMLLKKFKGSVIEKMADLITKWEQGSNPNAALGHSYNNDGNLSWPNPDTIPDSWIGAVGIGNQNIVIFDTLEHGRAALIHQLTIAFNNTSSVYNSAMSLYDFFKKYAEANSSNYAEFVANGLGVDPNTKLEDIKA